MLGGSTRKGSAARRVADRPRSRYNGGTSKAVRWMAKQAVEVQVVEKGGMGRLVQQTLRENGGNSFKNIREACHMEPVTTDIPMLRDRTRYSVFLLLRAEACDMEEIRAYSAVSGGPRKILSFSGAKACLPAGGCARRNGGLPNQAVRRFCAAAWASPPDRAYPAVPRYVTAPGRRGRPPGRR